MEFQRGRDEAAVHTRIVGPGYFRKFETTIAAGSDAMAYHSTIVTTPKEWAERPESHDPEWQVALGSDPLVIAFRFTS